jgi:hypothetical protein
MCANGKYLAKQKHPLRKERKKINGDRDFFLLVT